jgi:predicted nuclease with TOPRIM domain
MADTNDILKALESLKSGMATKSDLDVIKKDMVTKTDLQDVKHAQVQTNTKVDTFAVGQAQIITTLKVLEAGQEDIREKMATKDDIHRLEQKIDKVDKHVKSHESRIDNLEDEAGLPNPHKN